MVKPSNFRLKDARTIIIGTNLNNDGTDIINGKDVQRIRILNDIVWEKTKPTSLTLSSTPSSVISGKTFNLTAIVTDSTGKGINGNINFTGNGISGTKTVKAVNGVAKLSNISTTNIGQNTYKATFEKTDIYLGSSDTTKVTVSKETPILTVYGDKTVYNTWKIGVKMTASDGKTVLKNKTITLTINGKNFNATTNKNGIASYKIDTSKTGTGTKTAKYTFDGSSDTKYNSKNISQKYTINTSKDTTLSYNNCSLGSQSSSNGTQSWIKNNNTSFQCRKTGQTCYQNIVTIGTASGTYKKPDLLKIYFNKGSISIITAATLTFSSQSLAQACNGSYLGGWFDGAPSVKLSTDGSKYTQGSGAKGFSKKTSGGYSYSSHDVLNQKITWGQKTVSANPIIAIQYPKNSGYEEACIKLTSISLKVSYIPTQSTKF